MAEPKPSAEKPNLVAVAPEAKEGPKDEPARPAGPAPVGGTASTAGAPPSPGRVAATPDAPREKEASRGSRWLVWLLVAGLAVASLVAWVQSERLGQAEGRVSALSEEVLGLEAQLSAANMQISTYEMQRGQVREAVSDITQRVLLLSELVGATELPPTPEAEGAP